MPTVEEIETAFANKEGESQVFPGLNSVQRKEILTHTKEMRKINYHTFLDLMSECRLALDQFYIVIEQIPAWFNSGGKGLYRRHYYCKSSESRNNF